MRTRSPLQEATFQTAQARDAFIRAAAACADYHDGQRGLDGLAEALFQGALGLMRVVKADPDQRALDAVETHLRAEVERREQETPHVGT